MSGYAKKMTHLQSILLFKDSSLFAFKIIIGALVTLRRG
jgi:hypothetical protein